MLLPSSCTENSGEETSAERWLLGGHRKDEKMILTFILGNVLCVYFQSGYFSCT
jgi:hypothetical protein